jgi:uncharacterized protein (TIGR02757 family)
MISAALKKSLNDLHTQYNRRGMIHPDPLEFLWDYPDPRDREIVALVASSLAYGRVAQILKSVRGVLDRMGSPARFLKRSSESALLRTFGGFRHRFTTGEEIAALLYGAKRASERHGSLLACFEAGLGDSDETILGALSAFVAELSEPSGGECGSLLASPADGSACKRLNLFLRWLVRRDEVDPGGWESVGAARLVIPLDVHIHRICRTLGLTRRNAADMRTALEITRAFQLICPGDPIRYDFSLSRLGIRKDADPEEFFNCCRVAGAARG